VAQRLPYHFQSVEHVDGGQHMRRVSPLPAARLDQLFLLEHRQQGLEEQTLSATSDEAIAKLRQDRGIKAWVFQREREGVLPINSSPHRIRRLAVGQAFHKLEDGD
jgi:hypothetical protein